MNKMFKFLAWPYPRKKLLFQVLFLLAVIRLGLWLTPSKFWIKSIPGAGLKEDALQTDWIAVNEVTSLVRLCSRVVPHATCLTQALAVRIILRRIGQNCTFKLGVDRDEDEKLLAHAWIEVEGKIVIGRLRDIRRYSVLSRNREQVV